MNKIKQLLEEGVITLEEILNYADDYRNQMYVYDQDDYDNFEPEYDYHGDNDIQYVVASTSKRVNETYVFPSDESGEIGVMLELGGIAERFGHDDWQNHKMAVDNVMGEGIYEFVRNILQTDELSHNLYKRVEQ